MKKKGILKRYDLRFNDYFNAECNECNEIRSSPEGDFCLYEDVAELEEKHEQARRVLTALYEELQDLVTFVHKDPERVKAAYVVLDEAKKKKIFL